MIAPLTEQADQAGAPFAAPWPLLSRPVPAWRVLTATAAKNLRVARRYLPNLLGRYAQLGLRVAFFLLMATVVTVRPGAAAPLAGRELFAFFLAGMLLVVFIRPSLYAPLEMASADLQSGTLEYLFATPGSRYGYLAGAVLSELALGLVGFLPLFGVLLWTARPTALAAALMLAACALMLVALTALGVLMALLAILWRQVGSIAEVLGVVFEMLAGAYLPVSAFPAAVRGLACALPYTWGYDLVRHYALGERWATLLPPWQEWAMIAAHAVLYTALSLHLLRRAERRAKQTGLHVL
jgi:ABC-2 type transport system permease protein